MGRFILPSCKRRISERELACDLGILALVSPESGRSRLGGTAMEVFAVMDHSRSLLSVDDAVLSQNPDAVESMWLDPSRVTVRRTQP
jgi:hypothetical protein